MTASGHTGSFIPFAFAFGSATFWFFGATSRFGCCVLYTPCSPFSGSHGVLFKQIKMSNSLFLTQESEESNRSSSSSSRSLRRRGHWSIMDGDISSRQDATQNSYDDFADTCEVNFLENERHGLMKGAQSSSQSLLCSRRAYHVIDEETKDILNFNEMMNNPVGVFHVGFFGEEQTQGKQSCCLVYSPVMSPGGRRVWWTASLVGTITGRGSPGNPLCARLNARQRNGMKEQLQINLV